MRLRPFCLLTSVVFFATLLSTLSTEQEVQNNSGNLPVPPSIKPSTTPTKSPSSSDTVTHVPSRPDNNHDEEDGSKRPHKMPSKPSKSGDDQDEEDGSKRPHKMPSKPSKSGGDHDEEDGSKRPHKMPSKPSKSGGDHEGEDGSKRPHKMPSSGRTYSPSLIYCDTPEPTCQITPSPTLEPFDLTSGITSVYDDVAILKKAPKHLGAAVSTAEMSQWSTLFPPSPPSSVV